MNRMRDLIGSLQCEVDPTAFDESKQTQNSRNAQVQTRGNAKNSKARSAIDVFLDDDYGDDDKDDGRKDNEFMNSSFNASNASLAISSFSSRHSRTTTTSSLSSVRQSPRSHNESQQSWNLSGWISQNLTGGGNSKQYTENKATYAYLMGKSKSEMGLWDEALTWWNKALIIQRRVYGKDNAVTAETLNCIGVALIRSEQYYGAMTALEECLHIRKQVLGYGHEDTLQTKKNIALLFRKTNASVFQEEENDICDEDSIGICTTDSNSNNKAKQS